LSKKRKRHSAEQIVKKLRDADAVLANRVTWLRALFTPKAQMAVGSGDCYTGGGLWIIAPDDATGACQH
jgi:hypothetical protein